MSDPNSSDTLPKGAALITGASAGIGAVYANRLAHRGHDLILVARDRARLEILAQTLRAETGVAVEVLAADLTDSADLLKVEDRLKDPAISVLVNNAGVALMGAQAADPDPDRLEAMITLNVVALTRLAHAAVKTFKARGDGALINIGSVVGIAPEIRSSVYGATKAYVLRYSQGLQVELSETKIRVQAVLPGATATEIWERSGGNVEDNDPARVMTVDDLVDAALAGFDQGELVSITSLPNAADWQAFERARQALLPNISHNKPASRYGVV
jgi:short-subunit dehydrogenase